MSIRLAPLPRAAALAIAALGFAACSTPAMKATPFWDAEYPKAQDAPENRVNAWPLYYRRDPAVSVLWPLISAAPDGHAVVPFYEWREDDARVLRLGAVHQYIPALAWFGSEGGWRVLIAGGNRREGWWLLPPLAWVGDKGFWTLPLLHMKTDHRETWGFAFPLAASSRTQDESAWWAFPFAISSRSPQERRLHVLWPLAEFHRATDGRSRDRVLPLWWRERRGDDAVFASLPWGRFDWGESRGGWLLPPLWISAGDEKARWSSVLLLGHEVRLPTGTGRGVAPLFYIYRGNDGEDRRFYSPLVSWKSGGRLLSILGPLYVRTGDETDGRFRSVAWPLTGWWRSEESTGGWVFPLVVHRNSPATGERTTITPLVASVKTADGTDALFSPLASFGEWKGGRFVNVGGLLANRSENDARREWWLLAPFVHANRERGDDRETHIAPLFWEGRAGSRAQFRALIGLGYSRVADTRSEEEVRNAFAPFVGKAGVDMRREGALLWMLGRKDRIVARRDADAVGALTAQGEEWNEAVEAVPATYARERSRWLFPLLYEWRDDAGGSKFNVLWRLWDEDRSLSDDGEEYVRQRLLWRVYHRERMGERTSTDVFPFMAFDRAEDLRSWSFAGGLLGRRREATGTTWRVLWIPIGGTSGAKADE